MKEVSRLRRLMDSTSATLVCLLIFVVRATFTFWAHAGSMTRALCVLSILASLTGLVTNKVAQKLVLPGR